ncbi:MAG: response regulator [Candidatus Omnitrophota bacterium]|nr:MAG: response regulator [Candidatus Omnitrophota bacterium]
MEKRKVMVVDDEEDFLKIIKLNLEKINKYEIRTVKNTKETLSCVHRFKPDVILLDILMPKIGGIEVCQMLNNDPVGRRIPIIILSALDKDADKLRAYRAGVVDYLVKPVEKEEIVAAIEKALEFRK